MYTHTHAHTHTLHQKTFTNARTHTQTCNVRQSHHTTPTLHHTCRQHRAAKKAHNEIKPTCRVGPPQSPGGHKHARPWQMVFQLPPAAPWSTPSSSSTSSTSCSSAAPPRASTRCVGGYRCRECAWPPACVPVVAVWCAGADAEERPRSAGSSKLELGL